MKNIVNVNRISFLAILFLAVTVIFLMPDKASAQGADLKGVGAKEATQRLVKAEAFVPEGCQEYKVKIDTGDEAGAGSDANIFLTITGRNGSTGEINITGGDSTMGAANGLCDLNGKEFKKVKWGLSKTTYVNYGKHLNERNTTYTIYVYARPVGKLESITVRSDNSGPSPGWYASLFNIDNTQFVIKNWFTDNSSTQIIKLADASAKYTFKVKTGDLSGAGTDANIFVTITDYKSGASTQETVLNPLISGNAFERANLDTTKEIVLNKFNFSNPLKLTVRSDDKYSGSAWYLEYVEVTQKIGEQTVTRMFRFDRWFQSGDLSATSNAQ